MENKNIGITAILLATCLTLSGCSGFEIFKYDSVPVVRAVLTAGATRASVVAAGGQPNSEVKVPQNGGVCLNYTLLTDKGATTPFFVVLTRDNRVANYGYVSCATALKDNYAMPSEGMKQVY
ncbi:hypothetical protein [Robbsia andropogonis]|uniref:hypothetical protein n=1 Tax=Robbsia andropogonis TaxID=28092 RepID=UPI0004649BB0|nr:hypothetical protein [Robbsia andropogonis]MCP1120017.1 hypothetical protein [Robbsia andropogonis]MCP1129924.1 hypothetical protein [Robbsia andropogonis]